MELNKTLHQSITALKEGKRQEAERLCREIILTYPTNPIANHNLGVTLYACGKLKEAEESFKKSIALKPDYLLAYKNLGITLYALAKFKEAEKTFKKLIEFKPDYTEAYYKLGITLYALSKFKEAEKSFRKTISLKSNYVTAHNNLGITLHKLNKLEEAEASYKKAIALKPDYTEVYYNLGVTLKKLHKLEEAEASYSKAITMKSDYKAALLNRGQILFEKGEFELSLKDFDNCNNANARSRALTSLYALERVDEIYKRIEKYSEIDNENIDIAAFSSFISNKEKKNTLHKFCNNPIDFLNISNLSSHLKNPNSFIGEIINELHNIEAVWEPMNKATHNGYQSMSNLFKNPSGKLSNLRSIIIKELDIYYSKFEQESCLFIKNWPSKKDLLAWHVILNKQGYQDSHIHSGGWLSGVIYLKVVPVYEKNEGAIEFSLNGVFYSDVNSPKVIYQPKLGDIVLFPSSLHHRTIPFSTDTDRISIAFDLMPKKAVSQK
jgi:Flp pilus assembly protein TadD